MCLFGGFLLSLGRLGTFINSGTIGNHAVDNGDLFVFTAFIYSPEFCQVSELPRLREAVTALGPGKRSAMCLRSRTKHKKAKRRTCSRDQGRE